MSRSDTSDRWREDLGIVREVRHDMNGPLTSVLGNVQLLLDDPAVSDPEIRETLREIETDVRRLAAMVRRLSEIGSEQEESMDRA